MSINTVITQIGLDKAIDANQSGVSIEITHIGFGTQGYTPSRSRHALSNEVVRVAIAGGKNVSANQMHLTALLESGEFACKEIGVYLSDGTLFAVASMPNGTIFYKQELNTVMQAFDLVLDVVPTGSVTINTTGDLSLYYAEEFAKFAISTLIISNEQTQQNNRILENKESIRVKYNQFKQFEKAIADFKNQVLSGRFYAEEFSQFAFTTIKNANLITEQQQQLADQQQQINALENAVNQLSPTNLFN